VGSPLTVLGEERGGGEGERGVGGGERGGGRKRGREKREEVEGEN